MLLVTIVSVVLSSLTVAQPSPNETHLIATALLTKNNDSAFECWQLQTPFKRSSIPGISGTQSATISNVTNFAYTILPPRYDGGLHNAPVPQMVHFLSGLAHLTLPNDHSTDAFVVGGVGGLLFATDTTGTGHITRYPSDQETVAIAAPFADGIVPEHIVLNDGPCAGLQTFV
ncbi:hypothetical protein BU24DRAFT_487088 [Aaosphaeria arxii CBS 175.79]|uniref:Small secreted protein n=1 Tax=Aaosphaeria arxii CBS 175.79 TaxID=1450172 RepID=A0A6A5Y6N5_9PLEO|nr:uncharacterized protein BU24DRAFT_487088 [Aaosphaeria arxii CBS 175.79]KAF2020470.1 hypothetical protein BU24DRAFT_487088 [Aaosphaeria arxii CBS 175.79]